MQQNFISFIISTFPSVEKELITPPLDGLILPGITRMSMLDLARQWVSYLRLVYTCNICCDFRCDFLLLMDENEWIHVLRTFVPHLLVHMHQKENIAAVEITAKNASVNEP